MPSPTKKRGSAPKLAALLAGPLLIVSGLFGYGVYLGDENRQAVLAFERDYLGWDAPAAPSPALEPREAAPVEAPGTPEVPAIAGLAADAGPDGQVAQVPPPAGEAPAPVQAAPKPAASPEPADQTVPDARALALPVTVRIKALVDRRIVEQREDWIPLVLQTVSEASEVYRHHFALELSLAGVLLWPDALEGLSGTELLQALREHPREGADVVLGFVARPLSRADYELALPAPHALENPAYALLGRGEAELPYLPGVLRAVGHVLGAQTVVDRESEAYRLGSFMREDPPSEPSDWIDVENRKRILERKTRPFRAREEPR